MEIIAINMYAIMKVTMELKHSQLQSGKTVWMGTRPISEEEAMQALEGYISPETFGYLESAIADCENVVDIEDIDD